MIKFSSSNTGKKLEKYLKKPYEPKNFRETGHRIVDILSDYLEDVQSDRIERVLPDMSPDQMMEQWRPDFSKPQPERLEEMVLQSIRQSNHLHHPLYVGHQVTPPLPLAALMDLIGTFLNNGSAVYEMGPVNVVMEKKLIQWMGKQIGFPSSSDGFFTSGGTLGNLTALLAARQSGSGYNVWKEGIRENRKMKVLISEQSHYSIQRAVSVMGLGENAVVKIPVNTSFKIDIPRMKEEVHRLEREGNHILALVASSCSTATGSYDQLEELAEFCQSRNIWLHVDGAHGAAAVLSKKYRHLLKGVHLADSIVWDAHKMMLMPALTTAVLFKNGDQSFETFSQKASYLFQKGAREEWYNYAHRTMECTKKMMGFKLYICLSVLGESYFGNYIDTMYDLTADFARIIEDDRDFNLAVFPESNIICFRYVNPEVSEESLNVIQTGIRKELLKSEKAYVVQTTLNRKNYLRCTIINPITTLSDLKELLEMIRYQGNRLTKTQ